MKKPGKKGLYEKKIKRLLDIILSLTALIILSPVMLVVAVLVCIKLGRPIIFVHERPGLNEKIFKLYKFRSMTNERDEKGNLLSDRERLTKFGIKLRNTSLDELPELINILKGDMSIVGPRPLETYFLPFYSSEERNRHNVLPGLTGLAQVNGRTAIQWEERFEYDLIYVNNLSFWLDVKIVIKTFKNLFDHSDIILPEENDDFDVYREKQWEMMKKG